MKAVIYVNPGKPEESFAIKEVTKPTPNSHQILIRVKATSINISDYNRFTQTIDGGKLSLRTKMMDRVMLHAIGNPLGAEVSGVVESVGKDVTAVKVGDEVFAATLNGLTGGWAEYALTDDTLVCHKPNNLSFEEAAVIPVAGTVALDAVRKAKIRAGNKVLVYGASGGVGHLAVQLSKAEGANVTAVCSTRNIEMVRSIGADEVVDYYKDDFTKTDKRYDAIIACNGYNPIKVYKKLLTQNGIYIAIGGAKQALAAFPASIFSKNVSYVLYKEAAKKNPLPYLKEVAEAGKLKPFIDRVYSIDEIPEAIHYMVKTHAQGKVGIRINL
jgi:NADPH:quinone reductase-like Zn-dependent oxidoreductase